MTEILLNNYLLWINILIPFAIALFLYITNKEYSLKEFGIQSSLSIVIVLGMFYLGYGFSDVSTTSYKSTKVNKFVYEEEWSELVRYSESYKCGKGTCTRTLTRIDHHPDSYYITSSYGTSSISKSNYLSAAKDFGEMQTDSGHMGQVSFGNGRTFQITPSRNIVFADSESEVNYVYASKTNIIKSSKFKDLEERYKKELVNYPEIYKDPSQYGTPNFRRVINSKLVSQEISDKLQKDLEQLSVNFPGNPMIYLTSSPDREFAYVVKGYLKDAFFNDAMLVVGVKDDKILWTEAFSIKPSAEFKVYSTNLTDNFSELSQKYSEVLKQYWTAPNLEDFKYLAGDIDLPLWYEAIIVLLNIVGSFFVFRYMLTHEL